MHKRETADGVIDAVCAVPLNPWEYTEDRKRETLKGVCVCVCYGFTVRWFEFRGAALLGTIGTPMLRARSALNAPPPASLKTHTCQGLACKGASLLLQERRCLRKALLRFLAIAALN